MAYMHIKPQCTTSSMTLYIKRFLDFRFKVLLKHRDTKHLLSIHDINTQKSTSIRRAKGVYINNTTATRQPERCIAWHEWPKISGIQLKLT